MITLPRHISFTLEHNPQTAMYTTVRDFVEQGAGEFFEDEWVSPEQRAKAIATNELWTATWYPDTPTGCCVLSASDLDVLLAKLAEIAGEESGE